MDGITKTGLAPPSNKVAMSEVFPVVILDLIRCSRLVRNRMTLRTAGCNLTKRHTSNTVASQSEAPVK